MRKMICAVVLSAFAAVPALAKEAPSATDQARDAAAAEVTTPRTVYVCDSSAMTRRAFAREFGSIEFVKAEAAVASNEAWTAPKCIKASEARRLKKLASTR